MFRFFLMSITVGHWNIFHLEIIITRTRCIDRSTDKYPKFILMGSSIENEAEQKIYSSDIGDFVDCFTI